MARAIAQADGITSGPVSGFTAVEPCLTWRVSGNRATRKLELKRNLRRCLFVYHYGADEVFGFMSCPPADLVSFLFLSLYERPRVAGPANGSRGGIAYQRQDNCFPWIADLQRAQALMNEPLKTNWAASLNGCVSRAHPLFDELCAGYPIHYYWTAFQTEWTMELVFGDPEQLRHLYPQLVHMGMTCFSSPAVMRFLAARACGSSTAWERTPSSSTTRHIRAREPCCARTSR